MHKILSINPGSTSTKIAVYQNDNAVYTQTFSHSTEALDRYAFVADQFEFRKKIILEGLSEANHSLDSFDAIVGRGGLLRPIASGVYEVNQQMLDDVLTAKYGEHACNLGALLAHSLATMTPNCRAFITDPVTVDELQDLARVSGLPQMPRTSIFHALNQKAVGRLYCKQVGKKYEDVNLVIAHLGGGISISAHQKGRVIDTNQALGGNGPFSPERSGTLDALKLVNMCFSGEYTQKQLQKMLVGHGGLVAHLGTNSGRDIMERIEKGDEQAKFIYDAMLYNIAKEIGSMLVVLKNNVEAVILTGGLTYSNYLVNYMKDMIEPFKPIFVFPGEDEMGALAAAGLRVLNGEQPQVY